MPNFYHQTVKEAHEENGRSFGAFLQNHLDTMAQRGRFLFFQILFREKHSKNVFFLKKKKLKINLILGPDNVDGSKYIHEVNYIYLLLLISN